MNPLSVAAATFALVLSGCTLAKWEGFVYPNKKETKGHVNIGKYWSYEKCQSAAIETLNKLGATQSGKFECGLNCEPQTDTGKPRICEKTTP